jgi:hypothetical protein
MAAIQIGDTVVIGTGEDARLAVVVEIGQRADGRRFVVVPAGSKRERTVAESEVRVLLPLTLAERALEELNAAGRA